ncbi:MAG: hypothetical protein HUJ31_04860 [Pseudomonadales bacterium]|nr:hypothetical protein [Pseudomonadales bacterium]
MADSDDKALKDEQGSWPEVERRKGPKDRRITEDRRTDDRVVTENEPRRQKPDRRKN